MNIYDPLKSTDALCQESAVIGDIDDFEFVPMPKDRLVLLHDDAITLLFGRCTAKSRPQSQITAEVGSPPFDFLCPLTGIRGFVHFGVINVWTP